jgi:hypothetical protein
MYYARMAPTYTYEHTLVADVPAAAIWALYEDADSWPSWDPDAERISRDGPFTAGTTGTMTNRGQDPLPFTLIEVEPLRSFTDETAVGDVVVRVAHRIEPGPDGTIALTYRAEIDGPAEQTEELGPMITRDFPAVMASLVAAARQGAS